MGEQLESLAMAVDKTTVYGIKTPISDSRKSGGSQEGPSEYTYQIAANVAGGLVKGLSSGEEQQGAGVTVHS